METGLNDVFAENDEGDDDEAPLVVASPTNTAPVIRDASFLNLCGRLRCQANS